MVPLVSYKHEALVFANIKRGDISESHISQLVASVDMTKLCLLSTTDVITAIICYVTIKLGAHLFIQN